MNNITPLVAQAIEKLQEMSKNPRTKSFVMHITKAFGKNQGIPAKKSIFKACPITGKKQINAFNVKNIGDSILQQRVTNFLLGTVPTKDPSVLDFISTFGWTSDDTTYTVAMYVSLSSELALTRQAYIAVQRFVAAQNEEKDEFAGRATESLENVFQEANNKPKKNLKKKE